MSPALNKPLRSKKETLADLIDRHDKMHPANPHREAVARQIETLKAEIRDAA